MLSGRINDFTLPLSGDDLPIPPALYGSVRPMPQLVAHGADAAEARDDGSDSHEANVRTPRTYVNVESGQLCGENARMTIGDTLIELRQRANLSLEKVAKGAGYSGRSGIQRYFSAEFDRRLDIDVAERLATALEGHGDPAIRREEVIALAGIAQGHEVLSSPALAPRYMDLPRDVPVHGSAVGSFRDGEEELIEQTVLRSGGPIDYFQRPPGVASKRGIYGVYIAGSSQSPRFEEGEIAFCDPNRPPMIGDDVVVYLVGDDGDGGEQLNAVLIKRLLRRTAAYVELRQFNPPIDFRVPASRVAALHRVLTNAEMLATY